MVVEDGTVRAESSREEVLRRGLRALAHELTTAEARERERIARDLHDEIGQILTVARFTVETLKGMPSAQQAPHLEELSSLLAQASRATRSATFDLSSPVLRLGLEEALVELVGRLRRAGGPDFRVDGHLPLVDWPRPALWMLYRVVRELAVNVQRHAQAREAVIQLGGDAAGLRIDVIDDGIGIDPDWAERAPSREGGFGLVSAHAQMQALGGSLAIQSGAGCGTQATVTLPSNGVLGP